MTPRVLQLVLRGNSINIYSESKILRRKLSETCYVSVPLSVLGLHKVMVMINTGPGHRDSSHGIEAGLLACVGLGEAFCCSYASSPGTWHLTLTTVLAQILI